MNSTDEEAKKNLQKMIQLPHIRRVWKTIEQGAATNVVGL